MSTRTTPTQDEINRTGHRFQFRRQSGLYRCVDCRMQLGGYDIIKAVVSGAPYIPRCEFKTTDYSELYDE